MIFQIVLIIRMRMQHSCNFLNCELKWNSFVGIHNSGGPVLFISYLVLKSPLHQAQLLFLIFCSNLWKIGIPCSLKVCWNSSLQLSRPWYLRDRMPELYSYFFDAYWASKFFSLAHVCVCVSMWYFKHIFTLYNVSIYWYTFIKSQFWKIGTWR